MCGFAGVPTGAQRRRRESNQLCYLWRSAEPFSNGEGTNYRVVSLSDSTRCPSTFRIGGAAHQPGVDEVTVPNAEHLEPTLKSLLSRSGPSGWRRKGRNPPAILHWNLPPLESVQAERALGPSVEVSFPIRKLRDPLSERSTEWLYDANQAVS